MDIPSINEMIKTAVAIEAKEGYLAKYLEERASARGVVFGDEERRSALQLFEGYIRSVPELLGAAAESSIGTPVEATMDKVMRAAVAYWDEPDDLVPDALGVLGLLDDAYYSLRMLQSVSRLLSAQSGVALVGEDLSALDAVVRDILGEDLSGIIDDLVALSLSNTPVDELISTLAEHAGSFTLPSANTSFAGRSIEDLVDAHLSFTSDPIEALRGQLISALGELGASLAGGADGSIASLREQVIAGGSARLKGLFVEALGEDGVSNDADADLVVTLLVGAVVQRVVVSGGDADAVFAARCVEMVLGGAGRALSQASRRRTSAVSE